MDFDCIECKERTCYNQGKNCTSIKEEVVDLLENEENKKILTLSAEIEFEGYGKLSRVQELILFLKKMNYKKVGIAFCIGLTDETKILHTILSKDFNVSSVCCKVCGISKDHFKMKRLHPQWNYEATCNPVGQATILNNLKTEINIVVGLCIGHDILFNKYSSAPVTTLIVKDRVLAHNPVGALYCKYVRNKI